MDSQERVFVVDDDPAVLRAIEHVLSNAGVAVETFATSEPFLARLPYDGPSCAVLDLRLPGLTGLQLQETLARHGIEMPLLFMSGWSDVRTTAAAMRLGAVDFLEKPVEPTHLIEAVRRAFTRDAETRARRAIHRIADALLARLTRRESEVCHLVSQGLLNKQIAATLRISEKTVKVHRGRAMHKLEVDSVAQLTVLLADVSP